ncbi:MAG: aminoacetone oxidase family FAD-binding enzyme [Mageeibacillus sp.]|jgi:predicted Rossmann fold flavoprotein|nr:aminoacetone oxidase family FAD-binding enzyme [Mageeibacillus sp.]MCI1264050.1 aminoacetone oxidase family FAD-binding enzyme [Saccharofermentans sp.]MCI1769597.1 aminoacetone oxidase family FAD-binding enzyme [Mageeibacillus sp.]MCI2044024.1 aminoacetone oxidase family FAD-binding enzyme [Mageeibacillus sp.]
MSEDCYDCIIIGAGAAGLFAAANLCVANRKLKIAVIERNARVGCKLLLTGSGRCNITNDSLNVSMYNTDDYDRLGRILRVFGTSDTIDFFENRLGLVTVNNSGLYYPSTYKSSTVLDVLRFVIEESDTAVFMSCKCTALTRNNGEFVVSTASGKELHADNVIIATGGASYAATGSDGSGLRLLREFLAAKNVVPFDCALIPLTSDLNDLKRLAGIRVHCDIDLLCDGTIEQQSSGELLFTKESGISGICVLDISGRAVSLLRKGRHPEAILNFMGKDQDRTYEMLIRRKNQFIGRTLSNCFSGMLNRVLLDYLIKYSGADPNAPVSETDNSIIMRIAKSFTAFRVPVNGTAQPDSAQVCSGGVMLHALDDSLAIAGHRGLYVIGEAVNVNGICGGYNLQWSWSSAAVSTRNILNNV